MSLDFNDNPRMSTPELQAEVKRLVQRINSGALFVVIDGFNFVVGENPVAHGIVGHVPKAATATPHVVGMDLRRSRVPDERCVYFSSDVVGTADVVVYF